MRSLHSRWLSPLGLAGLLLLTHCGGSDSTDDEPPPGNGKTGAGGAVGGSSAGGSSGNTGAGAGGTEAAGAGGDAGTSGNSGNAGQGGEAGQGGMSGTSGQGGSEQGGIGGGAGAGGEAGGAAGGSGGQAGCPGQGIECDGVCTDLLSDEKNCGFCGNVCASGESCDLANCTAQCPPGKESCGGVCVDLKSDGNHCGACGNACDKGTACGDGQCKTDCGASQEMCDSSCVDTQSNPNHCGACGSGCPGAPGAQPICQGGLCGFVCLKGFTSCGGSCADTQADPDNCGACGNACNAGETCVNGACEIDCSAPKLLCGGVCVDPLSNGQNCGVCGKVCSAGEACVSGVCEIACAPGEEKCGGVCTDPQADPKNCGACGNACNAGEVCSAGSCKASCNAGQELCDGVCVDLKSDGNHCGACGKACAANEVCNGGSCALSCKAQLLGNPLSDQWGFVWDGNERTTTTLALAQTACEAIGGRLPTATELHRVSAARTSQVGQLKDTNYLWTLVPYDTDEQATSRLSDGAISKQITTKTSVYRCVCAPPDPPGFSGSDCTGSSKAECATIEREGKVYNIDAHDRARLNASEAAWECAFHGGHLMDTGTHIAAIQGGLSGGLGGMHWTSDVATNSTAMTIAWTDKVPWVAANATLSHANLGAVGNTSFRCIGPQSTPKPRPGAPAGFLLQRSGVTFDAKDRPAQKWAAAHDTCAFFGGHLAPPGDLMEAVFAGLDAGSNTKLWTADQAGSNGTQFLAASIQWSGLAPRTAWDGGNTASWAYKNGSPGQPFRCAYYPLDAAYQGPDPAQCNGACFPVPPPVGSGEKSTSLWFDALDRPAATVAEAVAACHKNGGRLPRERDYTEAIRAGLPNGSTELLFTSDFAFYTTNATRRVHLVRWSQQETAFDDQYSKYMTWADVSTKRPYRCMWTGELR